MTIEHDSSEEHVAEDPEVEPIKESVNTIRRIKPKVGGPRSDYGERGEKQVYYRVTSRF